MNNAVGIILLSLFGSVLLIISVCQPDYLSDNNKFLQEFMNQNLLSILGVIVAITIASASQVHLELGRMEEKHKAKNAFLSTKIEVRRGSFCLIYLFLFALLIVVMKPVLAHSNVAEAIFNSLGLFTLFWNMLILTALIQLVFKIGPVD